LQSNFNIENVVRSLIYYS